VSRVTVSVDPHVHSEGSYDGHEPVELILEHAAEIGLDAVVVTDHDVIRESNRAAAIAPEYGLIGIPGVEVSTAHGHLLAIGVNRMPLRGRPYDETVRKIHEQGGVAVVPHPFQRSRHGVRRGDVPTPESDEEIDAIEAFNAWLFTGNRNRRARRFATEHGYPGVAASDAHHLQYVGRAFTELTIAGRRSAAEVTADDVLAAIRRGTTTVEGRRAPIRMAAKHYVGAAGRRSAYHARTGAVRGARATKRTAVDGAVAAKVAALQSVHRTRRLLSWFA